MLTNTSEVEAPAASGLTPRRFYRVVAVAETVTWSLLILGMILKYGFDLGTLPVLIGGSIHGFVFLTYAAGSVLVGVNQRWRIPTIALAVLTAIIPYVTIPFERSVDRRGMLDGDWQREAHGSDDDGWMHRLLRWFLKRPALLITVYVVVVVGAMVSLLLIGPPGGWS